MKSNIICPKCYFLLQKSGKDIICTNCGAKFHQGDKITIPLKDLLKIKSKEASTIRKTQPKRKNPRIIQRKKHSTGFYGVSRISPKKNKPKGCWRYRSKALGISIVRTNINELKKEVLRLGGEWKIVNKEVAEKSMKIDRRYNDA